VWDNPKTVVIERRGELIVWNPIFGQVALDYRFAPELCWPRAARQKGAVENLVGWVKGSFFTCRRFHDRADLERQLAEWLLEVNTQRPNRATGEPPAARLAPERARLRPLPVPAAQYALKIPVVVGAQARVRHAGGEYSMPPETIGQPATVSDLGHAALDRPFGRPQPAPPVAVAVAGPGSGAMLVMLPAHGLRHLGLQRLLHDLPHRQLEQFAARVAVGHALGEQLLQLLACPLRCRYPRPHGDASLLPPAPTGDPGFQLLPQECIPA
jgi:hypothetical protein